MAKCMDPEDYFRLAPASEATLTDLSPPLLANLHESPRTLDDGNK